MENNQPKKRRGLKILLAVAIIVALGGIGFLAIQTINANQLISQAAKSLISDSMSPAATTTPPATAESVTPVASPTPSPSPTPVASPSVILPTELAIMAKIGDTDFSDQAERLDTNLGKRATFTCRKVVVPEKAWNEKLSKKEILLVEKTTWVDIKLDVPEGMTAVIFAGGLNQEPNFYENGVLITVQPGHYEFKLRNGEIVIWYPEQQDHQTDDLKRILDQVKNGNFDIKSKLAFFGVTADLLPSIPSDLVKERNVQIIANLKPTNN